jgi:transcriptional regulator with XRE-family HTH domain
MPNALRAYREKKGLSQQEVADALGISRAMVGLLENGERPFTAEMAVLIEKKLGQSRVLFRPDLFRKTVAA